MTATPAWPESLIELLERQRAIVDQLAQLADSQAALISSGRTDVLLELLAQRQTAIDRFTASQSKMSEFAGDVDRRMAAAAPAQRDRIKALMAEISSGLSAVMKRDEQDQALLRQDRDRVSRELASMSSAQSARNAYAGSSVSGPRVADRTA